MAYTSPRTWTAGEIVTAALLNTHVRDQFTYFKASPTFDGVIYVGDTANANMTQGFTINQGANADELLAGKSSDIAHGITTYAETDTYVTVSKFSPSVGGAQLCGYTETIVGVNMTARSTTGDTTKSTAAAGYVMVTTEKKSGAGTISPTADENLFVVQSANQAQFIIDDQGDTHRNGTDNTFAIHDDAMLALAWEHAMNPTERVTALFNKYCGDQQDILVKAGILAPVDPATGRQFYNESALLRLVTGAVWQLAIRQREQERQTSWIVKALARVSAMWKQLTV